jgi:protein involved in polysaccharide export with SLBB domain
MTGSLIRPRLVTAAAVVVACAGCQLFHLGPSAPPLLKPVPAAASPVAADYAVCFPDVIELKVDDRSDRSGRYLIRPDGRVDLGPAGEVFAEGCTVEELSRRVADAVGVPVQQVQCQVSSARSRAVYLVGTGATELRAIDYHGPERATELLQRTGSLPGHVDLQVRVVRRNVARGTETETFRVDLAAIRKGDARTDIVLQPNDEVHVAEDSGVRLATFIPDWVRP